MAVPAVPAVFHLRRARDLIDRHFAEPLDLDAMARAAGFSHACFSVLDQQRAKEFYTEKLGFEVRTDVTMGGEFEGAGQGFRWLTVGLPDQPDVEIILADCRMGHDVETAEQIRTLVAKGAMGAGVMDTDDCQKTYEQLSARGVVFTQEPAERPYGIEAVFRDDSGNWFSLSQQTGASR